MRHFLGIAGLFIIAGFAVVACVGSYHSHNFSMEVRSPEVVPERIVEVEYVEVLPEVTPEITEEIRKMSEQYVKEIKETIERDIPIIRTSAFLNLTFEDMDLLERVAMAEAEGEDSIGKALVMLTVLNRVEATGGTIGGVIYAPSQFAVDRMWITPTDDCHEALAMVMDGWNETYLETEQEWDRTKRVFYFGADGYSEYGEPAFQYGGHYFSVR